jgi:predicted RNA-binding Zn ribbon-like protein
MSVVVANCDTINNNLLVSSWQATERYGLHPAPGGLALVQDFVNTRAIVGKGIDLLSEVTLATTWVAQAANAWASERGLKGRSPVLTINDVAKLRDLRGVLHDLLTGGPPSAPVPLSGAASFALSDDGEVRWEPTGKGWRWLSSALWSEVLLSQQNRTWLRLKTCRNARCSSAFYDRSKNGSGVWHDVKVCGNAANLRASRARRRTATHG